MTKIMSLNALDLEGSPVVSPPLPLLPIRSAGLGPEFYEPALISFLKCPILEYKSPSAGKQLKINLHKSLNVLDSAAHIFLPLTFCSGVEFS